MSANTPGSLPGQDYLRSDAGGAIPWIAGVLLSLGLLIQMIDAARPGQTSLSDAVGPPVSADRL